MIGTLLDEKYRIERLLGQGGMGAVYAAEDVRTGATVAVKIIQTLVPARASDLVTRFEREARAAGSIDTEHIARCLGAGTDPASGQPYMALEYLVGDDLGRVLKRTGALDPDVALRIVAQACAGLARAHEAGIVHRDIKPANLFLAKDSKEEGRRVVKILDFGVAKILSDPGETGPDSDGLTRTGSLLGSPLYMSPEQARSVKTVDQRADLWSLGVVLYKALAGRTPFDHISALGDMILALWSEPPTPVQQFAPWVAPEIAAVVDRLLQMEPKDRFQSATELLAVINPMIRGDATLHESMLVPCSEEARARGAPTFFRRFDTKSRGFDRPKTDPTPAPVNEATSGLRSPGAAARAITADAPSGHDSNSGAVRAMSDSHPNATSNSAPDRAVSDSHPNATSNSGVRAGSVSRGTSEPAPPAAVTQNGLVTTGAAPAGGARSLKAVLIAGVGVAIGVGAALLIAGRPGSAAAPSTPSANAASADVAPPRVPQVAPAPEPTTSATAATTAIPTSTATASPAPTPSTSAASGLHGALPPSAKPKATAAPAAPTATAAPATTPKFTDFGDRK